jgi:methylated-DNA-protein-cysteine methyltransferase-like protein
VSARPATARSEPGYDRLMCARLDGRLPIGFRVVAPATPFERDVERVVRLIPRGQVASYGRVAAWVGRPEAARAVGRVMARADGDLPWHRVVTANGRLVPGHEVEHARRLRSEGVRVAHGHVAESIPWWRGEARRGACPPPL